MEIWEQLSQIVIPTVTPNENTRNLTDGKEKKKETLLMGRIHQVHNLIFLSAFLYFLWVKWFMYERNIRWKLPVRL